MSQSEEKEEGGGGPPPAAADPGGIVGDTPAVRSGAVSIGAETAPAAASIPILRRRAAEEEEARRRTAGGCPDDDGDDGAEVRKREGPVCVIVVGMAGSGKTTLMAQLQRSLDEPLPPLPPDGDEEADEREEEDAKPPAAATAEAESAQSEGAASTADDADGGATPSDGDDDGGGGVAEDGERRTRRRRVGYCLNLDPATKLVPFGASIDIRDTVDYKEVMRQHNLGPNGAIMTSLNLFATKFDQVMQILERRAYGDEEGNDDAEGTDADEEDRLDYILVDTPGQIEAFTWSASGTIMSEGLASSFPTVLAFVVDTPRCAASPNTFMSNMLYACSMLYRTKLPLVVAFNKIDVVPHGFAEEWMADYEAFQAGLDEFNETTGSGDGGGYYASLTRSLSLVLDEFYCGLHRCGVSAATGDGIDEFWEVVGKAARDYETDYLVDLKHRIEEQEAKRRAIARDAERRLRRDLAEENGGRGGATNARSGRSR